MRIDRTTAERLLVTLASTALLMGVHPPAQAHHRPRTYCSESGDICQRVRKAEGVRKLRIRAMDEYFDVFHLCVYSHRKDYEWCAPYELRQNDDGTWGRSEAWFKQWPNMRHRGRFTVSRWDGDTRIGEKLQVRPDTRLVWEGNHNRLSIRARKGTV